MADKPESTPGEKPNEPAPTVSAKPAEPAPAAAPQVADAPKPAESPEAPNPPVEAKPEDAKPASEEASEAKPAEAPDTVPEKYELALEGQPVAPQLVEALTPILKEAGVKGKQAQALVDTYAKYQAELPALMAQRDLETLKADPELGKLNFGRTQQRVNSALAAFTLPAEREALTKMGLANNPTLVRMFHRIGQAMQEPAVADSGTPAPEPRSRASRLYGGSDRVNSKPN